MKKRLSLLFSILTVTLIFYACGPKEKAEPTATDSAGLTSLSEVNTITRAQFNMWKNSWEQKGQEYTDKELVKYFTMPLIDLQEFATHSHAEARFYMGLDTTLTDYEAHIMLVGVDANGQSILPSAATPDAKIYDFSRPCPKYCPDTR